MERALQSVSKLSLMARDLMSIPITTVASESSFSTGKKILILYQSRLLPKNVEATLCTKSWLYGFEGNLIFFYSHNYTILILY